MKLAKAEERLYDLIQVAAKIKEIASELILKLSACYEKIAAFQRAFNRPGREAGKSSWQET
jgi:hypothetical protein